MSNAELAGRRGPDVGLDRLLLSRGAIDLQAQITILPAALFSWLLAQRG